MLPPSAHPLTLLQTTWPNLQDNILDYLQFAESLLILQIFPVVPGPEINYRLSPIQYATFQFPQILSAFGNDVAVDRIDSASLFYRQTYPGAGWEELASSNSTANFL